MTAANGPWGTLSYTYEIVGNRLSLTVNGTLTSYTIGSYNKLLSAGTASFAYDNNGNRVTKTDGSNTWNYVYDHENRIRQVTLNGQTALQAWYDGDGRRIKTMGVTGTTVFHYGRGSWDPIYVKDLGSGVGTKLIFAGGLRIGKIESGLNYYYHLDLIGSIRLTTNSSIVQTFVAKYLPFGTAYGNGGTERFTYTGKQLDASTGLYYYGYRYYDSQIGQFVSMDPQRPRLSSPQASNRYAYAGNNPLTHVDSDGRENKQTNPFTPRGPPTSQQLFELVDAARKARAAAIAQSGQPIFPEDYTRTELALIRQAQAAMRAASPPAGPKQRPTSPANIALQESPGTPATPMMDYGQPWEYDKTTTTTTPGGKCLFGTSSRQYQDMAITFGISAFAAGIVGFGVGGLVVAGFGILFDILARAADTYGNPC